MGTGVTVFTDFGHGAITVLGSIDTDPITTVAVHTAVIGIVDVATIIATTIEKDTIEGAITDVAIGRLKVVGF